MISENLQFQISELSRRILPCVTPPTAHARRSRSNIEPTGGDRRDLRLLRPTHFPTTAANEPSSIPSSKPSRQPSSDPSSQPSSIPSTSPSTSPSIWLATVKGLVWIDSNFDGIQDANETAYGSGSVPSRNNAL